MQSIPHSKAKNSAKKTKVSTQKASTKVKELSGWYERSHRTLPWRESHDPYRIWVSEVMLQQTQVAAVLPYYDRFLKEFPTLRHLADAPTSRVLELWSGLGYYSRARNLQNGARFLISNHQGNFPKARVDLLEVPGIGPYTAGAVLSIAFDLPEAIVDGNVQRVLTRYYGWTKELELRETQTWLWEKASEWVQLAESPRILNQALMELGALVCRKDSPLCTQCPLQKSCEAARLGKQAELPARRARKKPKDLWFSAPVILKGQKALLTLCPAGEWWEGLWTVPLLPLEKAADAEVRAADWAREKGWKRSKSTHLGEIRHTVTHHRLHVLPTIVKVSHSPSKTGDWFDLESVSEQALSSLARKILRAARSHAQE